MSHLKAGWFMASFCAPLTGSGVATTWFAGTERTRLKDGRTANRPAGREKRSGAGLRACHGSSRARRPAPLKAFASGRRLPFSAGDFQSPASDSKTQAEQAGFRRMVQVRSDIGNTQCSLSSQESRTAFRLFLLDGMAGQAYNLG